MQIRRRPPLAALAFLVASLLGGPAAAAPTPSQPVSFEDTAILGPLDFFEGWDDVLEDGGPGEAGLWTSFCGSFDDADVGGGRLAMAGPNAPCGGAILAATFGIPGPMVVRASFEWDLPELGETRSLTVANASATDIVAIALNRDDLSGQGLPPDTTVVALAVEDVSGLPVPVLFQPISFDTANDPSLDGVQAIEFRLTLTDAGNGTLSTLGEFRLCFQKDPCESEQTRPFIQVTTPVPQAPLVRLPLAADEAHGPALAVLFPTAFTAHVLDLSLESDGYGDDYEDGVFDPANQVFLCGSGANVSEADGALTLDRTGSPCGSLDGVQVGPAAAFPGPQTSETTVHFIVPELCSSYGVGVGALPTANFGLDSVSFAVTRQETDPDVVVLAGISEPVESGPTLPTFARAEVPVASIGAGDLLQLRVALEEGVLPGLTPALEYRICPGTGCPDEGTLPFTPLPDTVACGQPPAGEVCPGLLAADLCPSADFGALLSPEPIGTSLYSVPEPDAGAAIWSAGLALAALARRRRGARAGAPRLP